MAPEKNSYAAAGVDTEAGDLAVELMKGAVARTHNENVFGGQGGFAGMIDASELRNYKRPLLATSTDGVGTKVAIAQAMDVHDTIGQDLVGMVVDDIVVVGAKPLLMTDYIACGQVNPQKIADIVRGVAEACALIDTPLLGGETAEHPGLMGPDDYDVAGAATGVVEADQVLGAGRVQVGDRLVALAASGLHSNGYSLVRHIVKQQGWDWDQEIPEFGRALGMELLEPTRLYTKVCLEMLQKFGATQFHALSHITGGGLGANISRVLPAGVAAMVNRGSWEVPAVFSVLAEAGGHDCVDLEDTWNLGVGMVAVVSPTIADEVISMSQDAGIPAWDLGEVVPDAEPAAEEGARRVQGAKGVNAGAAVLHGAYRLS
ncbi:phosphoribosylformylglycinamidine cyclo-ligase [Boudabousia tangfeifanii]|uniref:Phosphoribosylformylglycinamidine cyclo-ligase n=1 Tax=Boudabousia tangfeifanii TaxID=1912795 RepID=A0A1D9MI75_9ACTO|nr:phosphoribosylformylglycinamidine cyclo-ligase [Boudabousia tangfeifanii]AOZ72005.1 phosphoribosylformylglycinamidine cyclo-ligase [Boudabousia tangfeifanii]